MIKLSKQPSEASLSPLSRRQLLASGTLLAAISTGLVAGRSAPAQAATASADVGAVWWSELQTSDPARASAFYAGVMGWTPKVVAQADQSRPPAGDEKQYTLFTVDDHETAGAVQTEDVPQGLARAAWLPYIQVADVDASAQKAVELGGKLLEPPADVPNTGRISIIEDLEGARVGLITPLASAPG